MMHKAVEDKKPKQTGPGVYTGACITAAGETIYLRMELLTEKNSKAWQTYKLFSARVAGHKQSIIGTLPELIKEERSSDGELIYSCDFQSKEQREKTLKRSGYTEDEFSAFVQLLGKHGFHAKGKNRDLLKDNDPECGQWYQYNKMLGGRYIILASTSAEFDINAIPVIDAADFTAKKYEELYRKLLMTVGADFANPFMIEARGIFRNSYSVIAGTYKGISTALFGFAGAIAQIYFPSVREFAVRPMVSIQLIIEKSFQEHEYSMIESHENEPIIQIEIGALRSLYECFPSAHFFKTKSASATPVTISREQLAKDMGFSL